MAKTRWFIYTVLVGLIPLFIRLIIYSSSDNLPLSFIVTENDLITLGLVLNLSNLNEIENNSTSFGSIKVWYNGLSALLIVLIAVMFGMALINTEVATVKFLSSYKLKLWATAICVVSFILGYATFDRIKALSK